MIILTLINNYIKLVHHVRSIEYYRWNFTAVIRNILALIKGHFCLHLQLQLHVIAGGGKMRDPGNEVAVFLVIQSILILCSEYVFRSAI